MIGLLPAYHGLKKAAKHPCYFAAAVKAADRINVV